MKLLIVLSCCLLTVVPDLRDRRIPNSVTGAAAAGLLAVHTAFGSLLDPGVLVPAVGIGLPVVVLSLIHPEGFGMGDAKLCTVIVFGLGWAGLWALLAAFGMALAAGLAMRARGGDGSLPLAPFLAAGVIAASTPV